MNPAGVFKRVCALQKLADDLSFDLDLERWDAALEGWDEILKGVEELHDPMETLRRTRGSKAEEKP